MYKIVIIADCREDFPSVVKGKQYNDHYSRKSILELQVAITKLGYECDYAGGINTLVSYLENKQHYDNLLFLNFSDGLTQKSRRMQAPLLLELMDAKYSGSDPFVVGAVNDKYFTNKFLKAHEIKVPNCILYKNWDRNTGPSYPVVVKPNGEGSSIGISQLSVCHNITEIEKQVVALSSNGYTPIIENYVTGYEVTNLLIGNRDKFVLNELILSEYEGEKYFNELVFGQNEKSSGKRKQTILTTENSPFPIAPVKEHSCKIFNLLGLCDLARIDYRISYDGTPTFIEINSLPVFSITSEVGCICKFYNKSLEQIIELLINCTKERLGIL